MKPQVSRKHYEFRSYCQKDRWVSYHCQLEAIFAAEPATVLEVGVGDGVVRSYLRNWTDIAYTGVDVAEDLNPDVVGNVLGLPFEDNSFDVVCAFEVLEHLPFEQFEVALKEMKRVAKKRILLSLPHFGPPIKFSCKVPFLPEMRIAWKVPYPRTHVFDGEHYWEIGKRGYAPRRIRAILSRYGTIERDFIPFENQYHHFYTLRI